MMGYVISESEVAALLHNILDLTPRDQWNAIKAAGLDKHPEDPAISITGWEALFGENGCFLIDVIYEVWSIRCENAGVDEYHFLCEEND